MPNVTVHPARCRCQHPSVIDLPPITLDDFDAKPERVGSDYLPSVTYAPTACPVCSGTGDQGRCVTCDGDGAARFQYGLLCDYDGSNSITWFPVGEGRDNAVRNDETADCPLRGQHIIVARVVGTWAVYAA